MHACLALDTVLHIIVVSWILSLLSLYTVPAPSLVHSPLTQPPSTLSCLSTGLLGSAVAVPQTSSSPSLLLLTSSGSEGRTSSSHGPPLTTRGVELTTRALFVDWEEGCGLDSSILELQGYGYSTGSEDLLLFFRTYEELALRFLLLQCGPPHVRQAVTAGGCCYSYLLSLCCRWAFSFFGPYSQVDEEGAARSACTNCLTVLSLDHTMTGTLTYPVTS